MKWFLAALFVLGVSLIAWGSAITNGPGSADERVAGAFPVLIGVGFLVTDFIIALAWLLIRV